MLFFKQACLEYLQNEEMDLRTAVVAIQDLKSAYQAMRSENELNKLIFNSRLFVNETQSTLPVSEIATPPPKRRRCLPTRFRDGQTIMRVLTAFLRTNEK